MARRIKNKYVKHLNILPAFIFLAVMISAVIYGINCLDDVIRDSDMFIISRIELTMNPFLKEALSPDFYDITRHTNIFQVDIDAIKLRTMKKHPEFKSVMIYRKLPDVIGVRIEYKSPIALLRPGSQNVPFSADGVALPHETARGLALPFLAGVNFKSSGIKTGDICSDKKFALGVKFIDLAYSDWGVKGHRIDIIDLKDTKNISMFLENGIEVKVGDGNSIKSKILTLKKIMEEPTLNFSKIKYIDLRFSDVIIGPKKLTKK